MYLQSGQAYVFMPKYARLRKCSWSVVPLRLHYASVVDQGVQVPGSSPLALISSRMALNLDLEFSLEAFVVPVSGFEGLMASLAIHCRRYDGVCVRKIRWGCSLRRPAPSSSPSPVGWGCLLRCSVPSFSPLPVRV